MPKDYDIEEAFRTIENELINSMMRNLSHHRAEETKEGLNWTSWQAEQLKALNIYKQKNSKKFTKQFREINDKINKSILLHRKAGATDQEQEILEAIKKGAKLTHKAESTIEGAFFRINDRKLDALLNEVNGSMRRAETAMLRMANDQYRKVIFNSQVYFNTGAGTYEEAVDMATKDFLSRGINCIQYSNGARVNIASYASMALRTANTRAYCQGEGSMRKEWGISTVVVNKRGLPCPKCGKWTGKVLIDDVWSGGKASDGPYPLMSQAIAGGLYHPNCKDGHSTYFPDISNEPEKVTKKEMKQAVEAEKQESRDNLIQRNIDKFDRLSKYSLDDENKKQYDIKKEQWKEKAGVKEIAKENVSDIMNVSKEEKLAQYIGKPIVKTDNQSVREWYYANTGNIPNVIDKTQPLEEQVKQAFELRNQYKHEARIAMSDRETAEMLEKKRPAKTFEELVDDKMKRKEMSREEALKDILETASKTNADVNKEFGL